MPTSTGRIPGRYVRFRKSAVGDGDDVRGDVCGNVAGLSFNDWRAVGGPLPYFRLRVRAIDCGGKTRRRIGFTAGTLHQDTAGRPPRAWTNRQRQLMHHPLSINPRPSVLQGRQILTGRGIKQGEATMMVYGMAPACSSRDDSCNRGLFSYGHVDAVDRAWSRSRLLQPLC